MTSLHLSGSPWWLLLLVPGLLILWRQYRGAAAAGARGTALLALQAAALLVLVSSLAAPEVVRRHAEYHDPAVLVLRDRSGSFAAGAYLGLEAEYAAAEKAVREGYAARGFRTRVADFHARAWAVEGFPGGSAREPEDAGGTPLTSLAGLADFLDSAGGPNLQAAFLLSDGRANLDSGLATRTWPVPVFPIVLPVAAVAEVQPERVALLPALESSGGPAGPGVEVSWTPVGPPGAGATLRLLRAGRVVFTERLPPGEGEGPRTARLPWKPPAGLLERPEGLRAVVQPADGKNNFDPWNDTLAVTAAGGRGGRRLVVVRPVRSLHEKGMIDLLRGLDDVAVSSLAAEDLRSARLTSRDQVWVEAGRLEGTGALAGTLRDLPARVVVYGRPGPLPGSLAGTPVRSQAFSPAAEVRAARAAADVFPSAVVRLKALSGGSLEAPAAGPPWREAAVLSEGGRKGVLMGWFPLAPGREAFFLALPPLWSELFDPQSDFAVRENLQGALRAAAALAEREQGALKAVFPRRAYAGVPFDLELTLPAPSPDGGGDLAVRALSAAGGEERWPLAGPGPATFRLEDRRLAAGAWRLELVRGGDVLWRDSLVVAPAAALELARIGFDREALRALAAQSGGRLVAPEAGATGVAALLPDLRGAQVRVERTTATRLYNTRLLFLLAVGLLAASWLLRKRWNLD